jgi:hypothetical protein
MWGDCIVGFDLGDEKVLPCTTSWDIRLRVSKGRGKAMGGGTEGNEKVFLRNLNGSVLSGHINTGRIVGSVERPWLGLVVSYFQHMYHSQAVLSDVRYVYY